MSESGKIRIPLREWRSKHWEEERERRARLMTEARDTTIAGKFAEALGHIEAAAYYLAQVNEQYDMGESGAELRLITKLGVHFCNPALDFWLQAELAEDAVKGILGKLQRVEPLAPKEKEA